MKLEARLSFALKAFFFSSPDMHKNIPHVPGKIIKIYIVLLILNAQ